MPATEAQIRANQLNAAKSTGPKTPEGKEASRANALKHGLTATKVFPEQETIALQQRYSAFVAELKPTDQISQVLILRFATLSVRLERCVAYESAMLTQRARQAEADFVVPEGADAATERKLRLEAGERALFDHSPEATLARKYEAAIERNFFRCLKELRQRERDAKAAQEATIDAKLASIMPGEMTDEEFDTLEAKLFGPTPPKAGKPVESSKFASDLGRVDVAFAVGKRR